MRWSASPEDDSVKKRPLVDTSGSRNQSQEVTSRDSDDVKRSHRWRKKIKAAFPLMFINPFNTSSSLDTVRPQTVPEITAAVPSLPHRCNNGSEMFEDLQYQPESEKRNGQQSSPTTKTLSPPRTRLRISCAQKEMLLNWDFGATAEEAEHTTQQLKNQVPAEPPSDQVQDQDENHNQSQNSSFFHSTFSLITNAIRRTLSGTSKPSNASNRVVMGVKHQGSARRLSKGPLTFNSFSSEASHLDQKTNTSKNPYPHWSSAGSSPVSEAHDLPALLQLFSLKTHGRYGGVPPYDVGSLPRSREDLFSLGQTRNRESKGKGKAVEEELATIPTKFSKEILESEENEEECKVRAEDQRTVAEQVRREGLKRLYQAQVIQRQLEEVGQKQREVEERGVVIEKMIRGEAESSPSQLDQSDGAQLYQSWFRLVLEKNKLERYESELEVFAQELQLEDRQSRLQRELRTRMAVNDSEKNAVQLQEEQEILTEMMRTVEKRDMLVSALEEQRLKEKAEDRDLECLVLSKGYEFHWT